MEKSKELFEVFPDFISSVICGRLNKSIVCFLSKPFSSLIGTWFEIFMFDNMETLRQERVITSQEPYFPLVSNNYLSKYRW